MGLKQQRKSGIPPATYMYARLHTMGCVDDRGGAWRAIEGLITMGLVFSSSRQFVIPSKATFSSHERGKVEESSSTQWLLREIPPFQSG